MVAANNGELAARLHFEAEHTNVLVVTVELLNGCLASTEIENMTAKIINPVIPEFPVRYYYSDLQADTLLYMYVLTTAPTQSRRGRSLYHPILLWARPETQEKGPHALQDPGHSETEGLYTYFPTPLFVHSTYIYV